MATRQYFRSTRTISQSLDVASVRAYRDMNGSLGTLITATGQYPTIGFATGPAETGFERAVQLSSLALGWFTERFVNQTVLSGDLVFSMYGTTAMTSPNFARLRVKVSKVTTGGSNVETVLGQADATTDMTSAITAYPITVTLAQSVTVAPNERLMMRPFVFLSGGSWPTSANAVFRYDGTAGSGDSYVDLPGTIAFKPNAQTLSLRRTTVNAIGNFMDLLPTFGVTAKTSAVVNTVASGTEIAWTKTAGGLVAEWITPRFKEQWSYPINKVLAYASESATAANMSVRVKVFRRRPDDTEALLAQDDWGTELGTTEALATMGGEVATQWDVQNQATVHFAEDDRLILRFYAIPASAQVMGGARTGTISYDGPGPEGTAGSSYMQTFNAPDYKAETDPPAQPVPSGVATLGWGNGQ